MLHPEQFEVNEAWIAFQLNGAPIRTEADGDFNCIALMDAASCFILGSEFIAASAKEPSELAFRRLLKGAQAQGQQLPSTLFIARDAEGEVMTRTAMQEDIEVVRVPESELLVFIGEARDGFAERFE